MSHGCVSSQRIFDFFCCLSCLPWGQFAVAGEQDMVRPVHTSRGGSAKTGVAIGKLRGEELQPHTAHGAAIHGRHSSGR